ncbi:hypothetical protein [Puia dinghuensis]|uniref:Uncharacterized protein n=1 Tax=Puia dinghuensis TaxID=1792502 RepID=A0A8J2XR52_9BACT|nr:hypothetical protein [Puia dinghuensis]GGA98422.1 hypothetical protein GCM10011511_22160 [Puia dinghuensis]
MKNKQKIADTGVRKPPVRRKETPFLQERPPEEKKERSLNDDDIEADRHNGSGGAFEATEREWDDED